VVGGPQKDPYHGQSPEAVSSWLIGAICLKGMGSLWTISFTVKLLVPFEMFSLVDLGCLGLCLDE
jgi:hypothetical protein